MDVAAASFERERALLARSWFPIAHASDLAKPGDCVTLAFAGRLVTATRTTTFDVAAFSAVCPHRGTAMLDEGTVHLEHLELACPYHGLRSDLAGRVNLDDARTFALGEGACLPRFDAVERHGFVFVRITTSTATFDEEVGTAPPWFERATLPLLRRARRVVHTVRANWRLAVENFQESHHFPRVHPSLERVTPARASTSLGFPGLFLGGTMAIEDGADTVSDGGRFTGAPLVAAEQDRRTVFDALLFPVWMTSLQPDYFLSYLLVPRGPRETTIIADIFVHAATGPRVDLGPVFSFWDRTNAEDRAIIERQQRGLDAEPSFVGTLAQSEDGVASFRRLLARGLEQDP